MKHLITDQQFWPEIKKFFQLDWLTRNFWDNDLRVINTSGLDLWQEKLKRVTFHNKLGNQFERVARITYLSEAIAKKIGCDPNLAKSAASISKSDLSSEMVYEFPELQGVIGTYYAVEAGLKKT